MGLNRFNQKYLKGLNNPNLQNNQPIYPILIGNILFLKAEIT